MKKKEGSLRKQRKEEEVYEINRKEISLIKKSINSRKKQMKEEIKKWRRLREREKKLRKKELWDI